MELRHLRYFVAVAEEGSLTLAAERRLHTAQPSLSRQIRDLEAEIGVPLFTRSTHGVALTPAGLAFLDHARLALSQAEAAKMAARRAALPPKPSFAMGFLTGYEVEWLAEAMRILRDELASVDIVISSHTSPDLAAALERGDLDVAFLRPGLDIPGLAYRSLAPDPLVVVLPADHRLTRGAVVDPPALAKERFVNVSKTAPTLRLVIDRYIADNGLGVTTEFEADNIAMAVALVASTGGVALLPAYVRHLLPATVTSLPLSGPVPTIDLALGYRRDNAAPSLRLFLSRIDELVDRVAASGARTRGLA